MNHAFYNLLISLPGYSEWFIIFFFGFWIYTVIVVAQSRFAEKSTKTTWLLIVILLGFIGSILFWLVGRRYTIDKDV